LEALATWKGGLEAFSVKHDVPKTTLALWRREKPGRKAKAKPKTLRRFTPEARKQAVEAFLKAKQTFPAFATAWGLNERVLRRWVTSYTKKGPKSLGTKRGRKPGRKPVPKALRDGIMDVKLQFPDFGLRKVQGLLARPGPAPSHTGPIASDWAGCQKNSQPKALSA
jgi:transposase-like protein